MKKNIYLIAAAALMTACAGSQKGYTISGTVEGATDGDSIFLSVIEGRQLVHLDSAAIVNGQFTFKGVQDSTINAALNCETAEGKSLSLRFYLENGAIKVNLSDFDDVVTGTPNNDLYQTYRAEVSQLQKELNQMMEQLNDSTLTEEQQQVLESKAKETMEKLDACPLEAMRKNITNRVGIDLLKNNYYALSLEELEEWPRYSFEQGQNSSFYYAEEPFSSMPHKRNIRISDRGTLTNLLTNYNGYTLSTGVLSAEMHSGIASIPLDAEEKMRIGYVIRQERIANDLLKEYIDCLQRIIKQNPNVQAYLGE